MPVEPLLVLCIIYLDVGDTASSAGCRLGDTGVIRCVLALFFRNRSDASVLRLSKVLFTTRLHPCIHNKGLFSLTSTHARAPAAASKSSCDMQPGAGGNRTANLPPEPQPPQRVLKMKP